MPSHPTTARRVSAPTRLRTEHLDDALGLDTREPRLSWQLPAGPAGQDAYEVRLDDGSGTGRVASAANVLVPWPGRPLVSRERREWQVRVWTDGADEPGPWSEPVPVEAGLLDPADWVVDWVEPAVSERHEPGFRPAYLLRGTVRLDRPCLLR